MAKEDWGNLGDEIKNLVESAIDSRNYQTLNEALEKTVSSALNSVEESLRRTEQAHTARRSARRSDRRKDIPKKNADVVLRQRKRPPAVKKTSLLYGSTWGLQGGGMALSVCGGILAGGLGLAIFVLLLIGIFTGSMSMGIMISVSVMAPILAASGLLTYQGTHMLGRLKRFRAYTRQIGSRTYCTVKELAGCIGKSESFVYKDLRKMIEKRMFRQGHLDQAGGCLIVTDEAWDRYLEAEQQLLLQEAERTRIAAAKKEPEAKTAGTKAPESEGAVNGDVVKEGVPEEVQKVIREGHAYLQKIRESNRVILDETVSSKISRMELIVEKILERVQSHPELIADLSKFMEYYLPTTVKLLGAYEELEAQPVQGANIINSKTEIARSLDTINHAFENLLDSFFQNAAWDISSDISVLEMMLAQEGLTDDGLSAKTE